MSLYGYESFPKIQHFCIGDFLYHTEPKMYYIKGL